MPHEFNDIAIDSVTPPRMTDAEARAVIALWQSEQMDSPQSAHPTPADMAEGLGIETADAVRLLGQVRAARDAERQARLAARQEELTRVETEARLAEAHARQAEAEAREARANALRHVVSSPNRPLMPRISPSTAKNRREAAQREAKIRLQENRMAYAGWIITFIAAVLGIVAAFTLASYVFSSFQH